MASLQDTQKRHAQDVVSNNLAALMGDFTPAAMTKVMAIAANPINATTYEIKEMANNEVEIAYVGAARRVIWSHWVESGERWQIDDLTER